MVRSEHSGRAALLHQPQCGRSKRSRQLCPAARGGRAGGVQDHQTQGVHLLGHRAERCGADAVDPEQHPQRARGVSVRQGRARDQGRGVPVAAVRAHARGNLGDHQAGSQRVRDRAVAHFG